MFQVVDMQELQQAAPTSGTVHRLRPLDNLPLEPGPRSCEDTIAVTDGILYAVLEDDEVVLTGGDQIVVRAGELRMAWSAGDDVARVIVTRRALAH